MASRKTQYVVPFQADVQTVNGVVVSWLQANGFVYTEKDGFKYYLANSMISGARCFEYYFQGNQLVLFGYLKTPKKPFALDNGLLGAAATTPYVSLIQELVRKISTLPPMSQAQAQAGGTVSNQMFQQPPMGTEQSAAVASAATSFDESAEKRNGNCALGAFIASLLCFLLAFTGNLYIGGLGYFLIYTFAIMGLKSKKRKGLAIAAIIVTSISVLLFILLIALTVILKTRGVK